ncbi:MAG: cupin domain-containing protein [Burkholderiaceae bacterium]
MTLKIVAGVTAGHLVAEAWFGEGCYITEWMNNDKNADLSVARARVPCGTTTRWHQLDGVVERYVILSGLGRVEIGNLAPMAVQPGDCVTIPAATPQRISAVGNDELVFLAICSPRFTPDAYAECLEPDSNPG